jgi:hypothetical protein
VAVGKVAGELIWNRKCSIVAVAQRANSRWGRIRFAMPVLAVGRQHVLTPFPPGRKSGR